MQGDAGLLVRGLAELDKASKEDLSFLANSKYAKLLAQTQAAAVLVAEATDAPCTLIVCSDPYLALARIAQHLYPPPTYPPGVEPGAHVHAQAKVDPSATVRVGAIVEQAASVGPRSVIGPGCYLGRDASVGADVLLHAGARVLAHCVVGHRVILHAGVVIGADGFGYAVDKDSRRHKIPQTGIVVIEDDVEIGANSTVDRATFGETRLGAGTKIDNLVQVAHNVRTGRDCVVVSQSGIAGSATLGNRVIMGAQGGVAGHVKVTDDVVLAGRVGVNHNLGKSGVYAGLPAMPHRQWLRVAASQKKVPELRRQVNLLLRSMQVPQKEPE